MKKWVRRGLKAAGILAILAAIADLYQWRVELERAMESMEQDFGTHYHEDKSILFGQSETPFERDMRMWRDDNA